MEARIVDLIESSTSSNVEELLSAIHQDVSSLTNQQVETLIRFLLETTRQNTSIDNKDNNKKKAWILHLWIVLDLISFSCFIIWSHRDALFSLLALTDVEAATLRNMFLQGLHGAAPPESRNTVMLHFNELLLPYHLVMSPEWTMEAMTDKDGKRNKDRGQFATFMCSLVRGEIHLYLDELIDHYNSLFNGNTMNETEIEKLQQREAVVTKMLQCFFVFCEIVFDLLVNAAMIRATDADAILANLNGNTSSIKQQQQQQQVDDGEEEDGGIWSTLPSSVLLLIQKNVTECVSEIFDFAKWASETVEDVNATSSDVSTTTTTTEIKVKIVKDIRSLVLCGCRSSCGWIIEDASLNQLFISHFKALFQFSLGCQQRTQESKQRQQRPQQEASLSQEVQFAKVEEELWRVLVSREGDILLYLLPSSLRVLDSCSSNNNSGSAVKGKQNSSSTTNSVAISEREQFLEAMFTTKYFVNCLMELLCCVAVELMKITTTTTTTTPSNMEPASFSRCVSAFESGSELFCSFLKMRKKELQLLVRGEGLDALSSSCGYIVSPFQIQRILQVLTQFCSTINTNEKNGESDVELLLEGCQESSKQLLKLLKTCLIK